MAGKKKKGKWDDLGDEFKDAAMGMDVKDLRDKIATVSMAQEELNLAKADDMDLKAAQEVAKEAGAIYRDGTKANKLKISFLKQLIDSKGGK
jgi:hypothetical protein